MNTNKLNINILNIAFGMTGGGIDHVVKSYLNLPNDKKNSLLCVTPKSKRFSILYSSNQTKISLSNPFLKILKIRNILKNKLSEEKITMIICHGFNASLLFFLMNLNLKKKIKIIHTYHGEYHPTTLKNYLMALISNQILPIIFKFQNSKIISVCHYFMILRKMKHLINKFLKKVIYNLYGLA